MDALHFLSNNPYELAYLLSFLVSVVSIWVLPSRIALIPLGFSCALGFILHHIDWIGIASLVLMGLLIRTFYQGSLSSNQKLILGSVLALLIPVYYLHFIPGFHNLQIIKGAQLNTNSIPFNLYINAEKITTGLLLIFYGQPLNRTRQEWLDSIRVIFLPLCFIMIILLGGSYALNYVQLDLKISPYLWLFIPTNLLWVCMAEEVFFRGFIQKESEILLARFKPGKWIALGIASLTFGLLHYHGGLNYIILATLAGGGYGYAFLKSKKIESPILIHFLVNLIHFICFSYPALR